MSIFLSPYIYTYKKKEHYRQLSKDHTATINETVNNFKERLSKENLIIKNLAEGLKTTSPQTCRFYIQRKIHNPGNPGVPVIISVNCQT